MNNIKIESKQKFIILNSLYDRRDHVKALLISFNESDIILNNVYNTELNEINEIINELTR